MGVEQPCEMGSEGGILAEGSRTSPNQEHLLLPGGGCTRHSYSYFSYFGGSLATFGNCRAFPQTSCYLQHSGDTLGSLGLAADCPPATSPRLSVAGTSDLSLRVSEDEPRLPRAFGSGPIGLRFA